MMLMMPSFVVNTSNSHWIVSSRIGIAVGGGGPGGGDVGRDSLQISSKEYCTSALNGAILSRFSSFKLVLKNYSVLYLPVCFKITY